MADSSSESLTVEEHFACEANIAAVDFSTWLARLPEEGIPLPPAELHQTVMKLQLCLTRGDLTDKHVVVQSLDRLLNGALGLDVALNRGAHPELRLWLEELRYIGGERVVDFFLGERHRAGTMSDGGAFLDSADYLRRCTFGGVSSSTIVRAAPAIEWRSGIHLSKFINFLRAMLFSSAACFEIEGDVYDMSKIVLFAYLAADGMAIMPSVSSIGSAAIGTKNKGGKLVLDAKEAKALGERMADPLVAAEVAKSLVKAGDVVTAISGDNAVKLQIGLSFSDGKGTKRQLKDEYTSTFSSPFSQTCLRCCEDIFSCDPHAPFAKAVERCDI